MSSTEIAQRTPAQQLVAQVRSPQFREQVAMALPPSITPERFVRVVTSALLANPEIAKLDQQSVLRAMIQSAAMGLIPDGKQAAITPRAGKAVLVPMIQGFRDIAADHGWTLRTAVVYANDEFRHGVVDGEEAITHFPVRPGADRGDLIAAYAIAKHRDGRRMLTVLHPEDVAKRRASSAYDAVWNEHPAAMWEKSAGRDLFGQLGFGELDERVARVLAADLAPGEAAAQLYGADPPPVRPALETTQTSNEVEASTTTAGSSSQQADGAAPDTSRSDTASPAPGHDDEPSLENDDERATIQAAADLAAQFHPPTGQYKNLTLAEILAVGDKGVGWLRWALRKDLSPAPYRNAVWNFARVYAPDLYQAVLAEKEATA